MQEHFDALDLNKDGKLSRDELLKHQQQMMRLQRVFGQPRERVILRERRERPVRNDVQVKEKPARREPLLSHENAQMLLMVIEKVVNSEHPMLLPTQFAYQVLQSIDTNHDGQISEEEWVAFQDRMREARVDAILKRQGADKDGRISKEKAHGRTLRHFDAWDLNRDGYVDRDELWRALGGKPKTKKAATETPAQENPQRATIPRDK
jgi:Ca2+-binding EF-hand superfamily protein